MTAPRIEGFEIVDKIGEGGMAVVWKARQVSLDRVVAVKVLSSRTRADPADDERFQSEARAAAKLKHPGIVQVHDAGTTAGRCYFVMEYVAGYTVGEWIRRKGRLSEEEALVVAECVADALNYAWTTAGMIHCDIKPDNVIIDADGTVKVADLGLSRTINTMKSDGQADEIMGTPAYISPEQAEGRPDLDCRSDIYSLGAMIYHMVTGKLMFEGHPEERVLEMQMTDQPVAPKVLKPDLSPEMERVLSVMLEKDPARRPQTWAAAIDELAHVRRGMDARALRAGGSGKRTLRQISVDHARLAGMTSVGGAIKRVSMGWSWWLLLALAIVATALFLSRYRFPAGALPPPPAESRPAPVLAPAPPRNAVPVPVVPDRADGVEDERPVAGGGTVEKPAEPAGGSERGGADGQAGGAQSAGNGLRDSAEEMLEFAKKWALENPGRLREAIRRFARVAEDTRGTKYALIALEEIERLEQIVKDEASGVLEELSVTANDFIASGDLLRAAQVYEAYRGPFEQETKLDRDRAASALRRRHREGRIEDLAVKQASERRLKGALSELADKLVSDGVAAGLELVLERVDDPVLAPDRECLQRVLSVVQKAAAIDRRVLDSFKAQQDSEVTLDLVQGRRTLRIEDVQGDRIVGRQVMKTDAGFASTEVVFKLADLSPRERMSRMGPDTDPEVALVKGLMAFRAKSYTHARKYFETAVAPLSSELLIRVDREEGIPSLPTSP